MRRARFQKAILLSLAPMAAAVFPCAADARFDPDFEHGVYKAEALTEWFRAAALGRADIVGLGDSNQIHFGDGWDQGLSLAAYNRFKEYATGVISLGENLGSGQGMGYFYSSIATSGTGQFQYTGAPLPLDGLMNSSTGMEPLNYLYVPEGTTIPNNVNNGLAIDNGSRVTNKANLRFHCVLGTFNSGVPSKVTLQVRKAYDDFATLGVSEPFQSVSGVLGTQTVTVDIPSAPTRNALNLRVNGYGEPISGPFLWYTARAENLDRPRGTAVGTLYAFGLRTAWDIGTAMRNADDGYLTLYFSQVRSLQGPTKRVLVRINCGVNDRNEVRPSLGNPPVTPGNAPLAFRDNIQATLDRIIQIWSLNGWDQSELFFLISPTHPISGPDDPFLISYRAAADQLADVYPRTAVTHFDRLTDEAEMLSSGWYQWGGFDRNHLQSTAYEQLAARELFAAERPACWLDLNNDGQLDAEDVYRQTGNNGEPDACLLLAARWTELSDVQAGR